MSGAKLSATLAAPRATPSLLAQLTRGLDRASQTWKPSEAEFSVLENVCHLRDIEAEGFAVRIERLLREEGPHLPDLDGARLARERSYNSDDLGRALAGFQAARERSLSLVEGAPPNALARTGRLEAVGPITLEEILGRMEEHDWDHLHLLKGLLARR